MNRITHIVRDEKTEEITGVRVAAENNEEAEKLIEAALGRGGRFYPGKEVPPDDMMDVEDCPLCRHRPVMVKYENSTWSITCRGRHPEQEHVYIYSNNDDRAECVLNWNNILALLTERGEL